jgi:hypothetical protein
VPRILGRPPNKEDSNEGISVLLVDRFPWLGSLVLICFPRRQAPGWLRSNVPPLVWGLCSVVVISPTMRHAAKRVIGQDTGLSCFPGKFSPRDPIPRFRSGVPPDGDSSNELNNAGMLQESSIRAYKDPSEASPGSLGGSPRKESKHTIQFKIFILFI